MLNARKKINKKICKMLSFFPQISLSIRVGMAKNTKIRHISHFEQYQIDNFSHSPTKLLIFPKIIITELSDAFLAEIQFLLTSKSF